MGYADDFEVEDRKYLGVPRVVSWVMPMTSLGYGTDTPENV